MNITANLYYRQTSRDFYIDYNVDQRIGNATWKIILRAVSANHVRDFIARVERQFPNIYDKDYLPITWFALILFYDREYNSKLRVKRVRIPENGASDLILVEKCVGNIILSGTRFFCGRCGEKICESTQALEFPFTQTVFFGSTKNKEYTVSSFNMLDQPHPVVSCNHCDEILLMPGSPGLMFATIEEYFSPAKDFKK